MKQLNHNVLATVSGGNSRSCGSFKDGNNVQWYFEEFKHFDVKSDSWLLGVSISDENENNSILLFFNMKEGNEIKLDSFRSEFLSLLEKSAI